MTDRICVLRMKGKFFNNSLINAYAPTNDKPDNVKDEFYERLDKIYGECPKHDVKLVIGDANAQVGRAPPQLLERRASTQPPTTTAFG